MSQIERSSGAGGAGSTGSAGGARGQDLDPDCSCSEARAHLEAFLDHECSADLTERLAQHVASCDHCSRLADAETHLRAILRSRCAEEAPPELRARVLGRLSMMRISSSVSVTTTVEGEAVMRTTTRTTTTRTTTGTTTTGTTTSRSWRIERG